MKNRPTKKYMVFIFFVIFFIVLNIKKQIYSSTKIVGIENFPESYKPYLYALKEKYPNWQFTALYTGLEWNTVIENEYKNDRSLVPLSYSDNWKCTDAGIYNVQIDLGWVNASRKVIEYTMDPRNFLNEVRIFQFEKLSYDTSINTLEGVEKILYGTEFYQSRVKYADGELSQKYSELIWDAAVYSGVSPYHLASRIKQEVGPFKTHASISGTVSGYEGLYNYYNIGASSSTVDLGAIKNGLRYALDGNGASEILRQNYLIPWNTPQKAITGGAVFIGSSYISVGQNTVYLQKFDVNNDRSNSLFWHQYMTNCLAPYSESYNIYKGYSNSRLLGASIGFIIPVYNNMPSDICLNPDIIESDFVADNTLVYPDVNTVLNIRCGPSTSYEIIYTQGHNDTMTRVATGVQNGERWDKVLLENGMVGYAFQSYLKEVEKVEIPEEPDIPQVPEEPGRVEDLELIVEEGFVKNVNLNKSSVGLIKAQLDSDLNFEFYDCNGNVLSDEDIVGTGSRLVGRALNGEIKVEYVFLIYGDVNGDGRINSLDVLILQQHILEIKSLEGVFLNAASTIKNGVNPSALDVLVIQRHILEIEFISQK